MLGSLLEAAFLWGPEQVTVWRVALRTVSGGGRLWVGTAPMMSTTDGPGVEYFWS